jgi:hypothetical protein
MLGSIVKANPAMCRLVFKAGQLYRKRAAREMMPLGLTVAWNWVELVSLLSNLPQEHNAAQLAWAS